MVHVFYSLMNLMLCVQRGEAVEMSKRVELLPSFLLFLMVWNLEVNSSLLEQQTDQMRLTLHCEDQADLIERLGILSGRLNYMNVVFSNNYFKCDRPLGEGLRLQYIKRTGCPWKF